MSDNDYKELMSQASAEIQHLKNQLQEIEHQQHEPIAVIGMGCRFPGKVKNPNMFWDLLRDGLDGVVEATNQRGWSMDDYYDPDPSVPGKVSVRSQGLVDDVEWFDAEFFGIAPKEAERLDPQQRLLLEVTWEALELAGYAPDSMVGSKTGVFLGASFADYATSQVAAGGMDAMSAYDGTGNALSVAAGRLSYFFGLQGPCMSIDTACSSSLVAISRAVQSLRARECDAALSGGVSLILSPMNSIIFSTARMLSPDGRCKTFDADADGYVRGEGVGMVVLKRLSDALRDNDPVVALIRGAATNQDGRSQGLTAPNEIAQTAVIRQALANGAVEPGDVSYIEAHGTGTSLGDPIEMQAIGAAYCETRLPGERLWVGSAKTNLGHMETAAGIGGLIKTALCLKHQQIPPHLHFKTPSPHIDWKQLPVNIPTSLQPWQGVSRDGDERPRRLGAVSSFGFGGSNAHVILEQAPPSPPRHSFVEKPCHLLTLSARNEGASKALAGQLANYLESSDLPLGDVCYTANNARASFDLRFAMVVAEPSQAVTCLRTIEAHGLAAASDTLCAREAERAALKSGWLLTGRGQPCAQLSAHAPAYRRALEQAAEVFAKFLNLSAEQWLQSPSQKEEADLRSFVHQWALYQWWLSLNVRPARMSGFGTGEYVVAVAAGVMSLEAAAELLLARQQADVDKQIFAQTLEKMTLRPARTQVVDSLFGAVSRDRLSGKDYWLQQRTSEPSIAAVLESFQKSGINVLLSIGEQCALPAESLDGITVIAGQSPEQSNLEGMLHAAGQLWSCGIRVDWKALDEDCDRRKVELPTYPFQRKRYWTENALTPGNQAGLKAKPGKASGLSNWYYQLNWKAADLSATAAGAKQVVVFMDRGATLTPLLERLRQDGVKVIDAKMGETFHFGDDGLFFDRDSADHWRQFWAYLRDLDVATDHLVWGEALDADSSELNPESMKAMLNRSLLLAQSMAQSGLLTSPRLWLVTRMAVAEDSQQHPLALNQTPLLGMARVMAYEAMDARVSRVDLGRNSDSAVLADEFLQAEFEDQVLYRNEQRLVARLENLELPENPAQQSLPVHSDKSYLITGGLGGLGLLFARWLVTQGARHLVLTGRSKPSDSASAQIAELTDQGVQVEIVAADIALITDVERLFAQVQKQPALGGVIHAAGVLDDGVIAQQNWSRFERVLAPKVQGGWHLHQATLDQPAPDFFVMFSSIAATLGSPGQSNYAAANAFLDGLAATRRHLGLPAQVINWGPWSTAGMANTDQMRSRLEKKTGFGSIGEQAGLNSFAELLRAQTLQAAVVPIDWSQVQLTAGLMGGVPPVLRDQLSARSSTKSGAEGVRHGELLQQLQRSRANQRHKLAIDYLRNQVQQVMGLDSRPDIRLPMQELGMDSLMAVELRNAVSHAMGQALPVAVMFDFPSIQKLAEHLVIKVDDAAAPAAEDLLASAPPQNKGQAASDSAKDVLARVMAMQTNRSASTQSTPIPGKNTMPETTLQQPATNEDEMLSAYWPPGTPEPIAVIGMSCRFPGGAADPAGFWKVLHEGVDGVVELGTKRWDMDKFYDPDPQVSGKMYIRQGGLIDNVDQFDSEFFSISPREAVAMDPQQRLLLETSWHAIESAGYTPEGLADRTPGVYVGIAPNDYSQQLYIHIDPKDINAHLGTGSHASIASGRLSYFMGWQGPCMTIDTACSSSLVAIHTASQALRAGECDAALAGGCNLTLSPLLNITLCRAQMLAPDGHCKTFDDSANGYVRSEGCGMLLLKRLSDALQDGDNIMALVRGSAINQDGRSQGITAPNGPAQEAVIQRALKNAGVTADQVDYVEAHGTGTRLGDPIEVQALNNTYGKAHSPDQPLVVGAVKSNIGHCEAAAGVAGVIKSILAMQHGVIPANLNLNNISSYLQYDTARFRFAADNTPWPGDNSKPHMAAVSSFGFSGSNSHAILQQAPTRNNLVNTVERPLHLLTISGRSELAREQLIERYQAFNFQPGDQLADVAFTANTGRVHHEYRGAVVVSDFEDLQCKLAGLAQKTQKPSITFGQAKDIDLAFLFPGQGSQYAGMAKALYQHSATFQEELDACRDVLNPLLSIDLYDVLWGDQSEQLNQTQYTQPALFALEVALVNTLGQWGITPRVVMGHSVGEYAAAYAAGVFSLEDGARLIAARGRLMQALPLGGKMCAISAPVDIIAPAVDAFSDRVSIAAINGPNQTVISGDGEVVDKLSRQFAGQGFEINPLDVSHAFHSPLMQPMLAEFAEVAVSVQYQKPLIDVISNLTGKAERDRLCTPDYWVEHVLAPVQFAQGIMALIQQHPGALVEVGPKPVLLGMAKQNIAQEAETSLPMLACLRAGQQDWHWLLNAIAQLYCLGLDVDWQAFDSDYGRRRTLLPTYPFQGKRHWFEETGAGARALLGDNIAAPAASSFALLGERLWLPGSDDIRFQSEYSAQRPGYIIDHRLFGTVVVPGASHVSLFMSAARRVLGQQNVQLTDTCFLQPIVLPEGAKRRVQALLRKQGAERYQAELLSIDIDEDASDSGLWISHATAVVEVIPATDHDPVPVNVDDVQVRWSFEKTGEAFYKQFNDEGYNLGESFQWLTGGWRLENAEVSVWKMRWPELPDDPNDYCLYPSLIDACFQSLAGCDLDGNKRLSGDEIYIPFSVADIRLLRTPDTSDELWVYSSLRPQEGDDVRSTTGDILLFDGEGRVIAQLSGVESRLASRAALSSNLRKDLLNDCLYELHWKPQTLAASSEPPQGAWLILADAQGCGDKLAAELRERDFEVHVLPIEAFENPTAAVAYEPHLQTLFGPQQPCAGIIHLWALNPQTDAADWRSNQVAITGSVVALMAAIASHSWQVNPRLWLASAGAQTPFAEGAVDPQQAAQWGLARTFAMEHAEFCCNRLDLDPAEPVATRADRLLMEILAADPANLDDQILYRDGARYVARLKRSRPQRVGLQDDQALTVQVPVGGMLDKLTATPAQRRAPGSEEVEIEVRATSLNFRDVLNALGMFREYAEKMGLNLSEFPLGFDCAGVVRRVGSGVTQFKAGDVVVAGAYNALSTHVVAHQGWVWKKPQHLTFEQAAAIPTVFMTAWHALAVLAQLKPGDKVLIHAAAGGVGQAALQVALNLGAEVYATASPGKWSYLLGKGVKAVFNSREPDFADGLLAVTGGHGVDVVLNSLNGEFIAESLKTLQPDGRFIEIGKIDIWSNAQMREARPDVDYHVFDVAEATRGKDFVTYLKAFGEVMQRYERGELTPLPVQVFGLDQVVDAFRHLQSGRNVGKVVVSMPVTTADRLPIHADRSYLITGGMGSLGMRLAQWLIDGGAQDLILTSRRPANADNQAIIDDWQSAGVRVDVVSCDLAEADQTAQLMQHIEQQHQPLAGLIHAAGVLDDGMILQQDWTRFQNVYAPKFAAWSLHQATREMALDFFCCFSSLASLLGSPSQSNYAAANAYMDGLVQLRRSEGLPGIAFNWGPWAEGGMAADSRVENRFASGSGIGYLSTERGLLAFERWLPRQGQFGVMVMDWAKVIQSMGVSQVPGLLSEVAGKVDAQDNQVMQELAEQFRSELFSCDPSERQDKMIEFVCEHIASLLGYDTGHAIDPRQPLQQLGLDSLMAVELRNVVNTMIGRSLPATLLFKYPSVSALTGYLVYEIFPDHEHELAVELGTAAADEVDVDSAQPSDNKAPGLSDEEAARLLNESLEGLREEQS